jgi:hypothetical protein
LPEKAQRAGKAEDASKHTDEEYHDETKRNLLMKSLANPTVLKPIQDDDLIQVIIEHRRKAGTSSPSIPNNRSSL